MEYNIVTGGAGFIGSELVHHLNKLGIDNIVIVDSLQDGRKFKNLLGLKFVDIVNPVDLPSFMGTYKKAIVRVFHQGAISSTEEWNGDVLMQANYESSINWLEFCLEFNIPLIYASSASVYGITSSFKEDQDNLKPLNPYGFTKLLFDRQVERVLQTKPSSSIVGLRYFNVYSSGTGTEAHKDGQASPFHRFTECLANGNSICLYKGDDGRGINAEDHKRDFVHISDVMNVIEFFMKNPDKSGIYNVGSSKSRTFQDVANVVMKSFVTNEQIYYQSFPEHLKGKTQPYTCADLTKLRAVGYDKEFKSIEEGYNYV